MQKNDLVRLRHMLDAAREATLFARNNTRSDLDTNRMLTLSLLKCIEIIGEASARVSKECREKHPEIPWAVIIGMRNRLIHVYFDIDLDRTWDTVTLDLPPLIVTLEHLLAVGDHE